MDDGESLGRSATRLPNSFATLPEPASAERFSHCEHFGQEAAAENDSPLTTVAKTIGPKDTISQFVVP